MSIIPKLATSLNRRDEIPNQELAKDIVRHADKAAVAELAENLGNKNKAIGYDCIKTLYEIGYEKPSLISNHFQTFLSLLDNKENRLQWGAMTALNGIVLEKPTEIFASLGKIINAADKGSVITRDQCVNILIKLSSIEKYANKTLPLLLEQMMICPTNQLPMYAENAAHIINDLNKEKFIKTLSARLDDIEKESKKRRVVKVFKKLNKKSDSTK